MEKKSIDELRAELAQKKEALDKMQKAYSEAKIALALAMCPYSIGDVLVNEKGKRARVNRITSGYGDYKMVGINIRKDGSDGAVTELYSWQDWKKEG